MPNYVYGCKNKHRKEVTHGYNDNPVVKCKDCGQVMKRVPQPFRFYMNPVDVLYDHMDNKYREWRTKREKGVLRG